jgi:hypothetical protein
MVGTVLSSFLHPEKNMTQRKIRQEQKIIRIFFIEFFLINVWVKIATD